MQTQCQSHGCGNKVKAIGLTISPLGGVSEAAYCEQHIDELCMDYLLPNLAQTQRHKPVGSFEECQLHKVLFSYEPPEYSIVLKSTSSHSVFLFQTGYVEVCSVYGAVKKGSHPTPLTYEFVADIIHALNGSIVEAVFDCYNDEYKVYECHLVISAQNSTIRLKCRGSDAVGISFIARTPIKVDTAYLGKDLIALRRSPSSS